ncbi:hypothetical protein V5O48_006890 [Marasmius crinis-equi]|uniref:WW domain-containing protein n=1 Tax=Marasmius crinis-equi TaxID=585013 RepID=A0ABR3FI69_9AGAR
MQEPLPWAWEEQTTSKGQQFFTDTRTGMTMWADPRIGRSLSSHQSQLPLGWEEQFDAYGNRYFHDTITDTDTWDDPQSDNGLSSVLPAWQEDTDNNGDQWLTDYTTRYRLFLRQSADPALNSVIQDSSGNNTAQLTPIEADVHNHTPDRESVLGQGLNEGIEPLDLSKVEEHTSQSPGPSHGSKKGQGVRGFMRYHLTHLKEGSLMKKITWKK